MMTVKNLAWLLVLAVLSSCGGGGGIRFLIEHQLHWND